MHKEITKEAYAEKLRELEAVSAKSTNSCLVAKCIALSDEKVQALFFKKIAAGEIFNGISCLPFIGIPEHKHVYFDFECPPNTLCFFKPAFLVIVNVVEGTVLSVVDPYISDKDEEDTKVSLSIDIEHHWDGSKLKVRVKIKIGSESIYLPEVSLSEEGVCSEVNSGGGDVRAEAKVCWRGNEICVEATAKVKIFGRWYSASGRRCIGI